MVVRLVLAMSLCQFVLIAYLAYKMERIENSSAMTYFNMSMSPFQCDSNAQLEIHLWSERGWVRNCLVSKEKNGPWEAWERRRIQVKGSYQDDKEIGIWHFYHSDSTFDYGK
jgi:hypothetical protein